MMLSEAPEVAPTNKGLVIVLNFLPELVGKSYC